MKPGKKFVILILAVVLTLSAGKITSGYLLLRLGNDVTQNEVWIKYVYYVKDHIARESLNKGTHKIIVVSGSNSLFGIDNTLLEKNTGIPVVNMATHAGLPLDYLIYKILPYVRAGDIVVLPLELDYYYSVDGYGTWAVANLLAWEKTYVKKLPLLDQARLVWNAPRKYYSRNLKALFTNKYKTEPEVDILRKWRDNVNGSQGKALYTYLSLGTDGTFQVPAKRDRELYPDYQFTTNPKILAKISAHKDIIEAKGAYFFLTYPTTAEGANFALSDDEIQKKLSVFNNQLNEKGLYLQCRINDFHFSVDDFADTIYHLNTKGMHKRTINLANCINNYIITNNIKKK